ncbi:hypothetical protein ACLI1A_10865 [Flavobacterium sp. RHBU_3]|uniref:hypothetical protein n=1 Tax=Flavobacterium sp. RHBU_3 TaxID=3391184 RepID=UPI00398480E2
MKNQLSQEKIDSYFEILEDKNKYEKVRTYALMLLNGINQPYNNIEGDCKIIFNPYRIMFIERFEDRGLEHYFDVEVIWGDVCPSQQRNFKKAFVVALKEMEEIDYFNYEN